MKEPILNMFSGKVMEARFVQFAIYILYQKHLSLDADSAFNLSATTARTNWTYSGNPLGC